MLSKYEKILIRDMLVCSSSYVISSILNSFYFDNKITLSTKRRFEKISNKFYSPFEFGIISYKGVSFQKIIKTRSDKNGVKYV